MHKFCPDRAGDSAHFFGMSEFFGEGRFFLKPAELWGWFFVDLFEQPPAIFNACRSHKRLEVGSLKATPTSVVYREQWSSLSNIAASSHRPVNFGTSSCEPSAHVVKSDGDHSSPASVRSRIYMARQLVNINFSWCWY